VTERWIPGTFTKPLSEDFVSDGPKLRKFVELFCRTEDGKPLVLDTWQAWLIDRVLERYPDDWHDPKLRGRLRYKSIVISMARQNGKSELAQVFGFYGLMMHEAGPYVLSLASNADQATIIYNRVKFTIDNNPELKRRFKTTGTRGITRLDRPGVYKVKPAKADALQGIPVTCCLFDEVHLCPSDMWSAMVLGTTAKADGFVLGITTAGDDDSELLKSLYTQGRAAVEGQNERFGFFLWEAPEGCAVDDPEALLDANPALASGRLNLAVLLEQIRSMPEAHARRYRLNQFVASESSWLPMELFHAAAGATIQPRVDMVFSIDRTPSWTHATIIGSYKDDDGIVHSGIVADVEDPTTDSLFELCEQLWVHSPAEYVMEGKTLNELAQRLTDGGYPVRRLVLNDVNAASEQTYALFATGKIKHDSDGLLTHQMPFGIQKAYGNTWRVSRANSKQDIDAVMAFVFASYAAYIYVDHGIPIY